MNDPVRAEVHRQVVLDAVEVLSCAQVTARSAPVTVSLVCGVVAADRQDRIAARLNAGAFAPRMRRGGLRHDTEPYRRSAPVKEARAGGPEVYP